MKELQKDTTYRQIQEKAIEKEFLKIKNNILDEFNNHPVTREIDGGIDSQNVSGTLNGVTNLYSFIGFNEGEEPTAVIRKLLEKSYYKISQGLSDGSAVITFEIPTAQNIFDITPMPWALGRSWAKGIETGISGLGYYLKQVKNSRSGLGVQTRNQIRSGGFKNTRYISYLINKFNKELDSLEKKIL